MEKKLVEINKKQTVYLFDTDNFNLINKCIFIWTTWAYTHKNTHTYSKTIDMIECLETDS